MLNCCHCVSACCCVCVQPENVLLDDRGHIRISDFGLGHQLLAKNNYKTHGQAGTRGYQAPEVLKNAWYGCEIDYFAYGVTLYELVHGSKPWKDVRTDDEASIERMRELPLSPRLSPQLQDLLRRLLQFETDGRLGMAGWEEISKHAWFDGVDWSAMWKKQVEPPFVPDPNVANCSPGADLQDQLLDADPRSIPEESQKLFEGWNYNVEIKKEDTNATAAAAAATTAPSPTPHGQPTDAAAPAPAASPTTVPQSGVVGEKVSARSSKRDADVDGDGGVQMSDVTQRDQPPNPPMAS